LAGRWQYADRGILDRTHLRFFTAASGAALLADVGVAIRRRYATPLPLPLLYASCRRGGSLYGLHALSARLTDVWPRMLAYQFVFAGDWSGDADDLCARDPARKAAPFLRGAITPAPHQAFGAM
jgi:hypothetical protein